MREILFRGKRLDTGEWIYGDLVNANEMRTGARRIEIWVPQPDGECDPENLEYGVVDPDTVGQYTGLLDKNGIKVFEGDVLDGLYGKMLVSFGEIIGGDIGFSWRPVTYGHYESMSGFIDEYEVIGNIYDDKGLLTQEEV